jgi:hypothetical protein
MPPPRCVRIEVVEGDVLSCTADVLALKHANGLFGADAAVHARLVATLGAPPPLPEQTGAHRFVDSSGAIEAKRVLFVGVGPLGDFVYGPIRAFAARVLAVVADEAPLTRHVALTIHGPGFGLDEVEAFKAELGGVADAVAAGRIAPALERVSFVERNSRRVRRLRDTLAQLLPGGELQSVPLAAPAAGDGAPGAQGPGTPADLHPVLRPQAPRSPAPETAALGDVLGGLSTVGSASSAKPHIFVAMPFADEMSDTYHYGIQGAVNSAGYLCERADMASFTGDVIDWVKKRIADAQLVVADLSTANANVYLEVGYAWGKGVPTVLLSKSQADLKFDVKGQRCIVYTSIKHLEETLTRELRALAAVAPRAGQPNASSDRR